MKLLVATKNVGKLREYQELLQGLPVQLLSLADEQIEVDVEESGQTFEQNASLKAQAYAARSNLPTLADDSGLEVDALNGEPGVLSARYDGPQGTDQSRYSLLLDRMRDVPFERRGARFRCVIAVAAQDWPAPVIAGQGRCEGFIARQPRGEHGFGYDPVFFVPQFGLSMAELPPNIKNQISHRARAAEPARRWLAQHFFPDAIGGELSVTHLPPTSELRIRVAQLSDAKDLHHRCYPDRNSRHVERRIEWAIAGLVRGERIPLVAEAEGEALAYIEIHLRQTVAELSSLIVAEPFRRRGVATALLNVSREVARDHGAKLLTVAVELEAKRLQGFYRKRGFRPHRTVRGVVEGYLGPVVYLVQHIG